MFQFSNFTPIEAIIAFKDLDIIKKEEFFRDREMIFAIDERNNLAISFAQSNDDNILNALKKAIIDAFEAELRSLTHAIIS